MSDYVEKNVDREIDWFERQLNQGNQSPKLYSRGEKLFGQWQDDSYPVNSLSSLPYQIVSLGGGSEEEARRVFVQGRKQMDEVETNEFINSIHLRGFSKTGAVVIEYNLVQVELAARRSRSIIQNLHGIHFPESDDNREDAMANLSTTFRVLFADRPKYLRANEVFFTGDRQFKNMGTPDMPPGVAGPEIDQDLFDLISTEQQCEINFNRNSLSIKQSNYDEETAFSERRGPFYHWVIMTSRDLQKKKGKKGN